MIATSPAPASSLRTLSDGKGRTLQTSFSDDDATRICQGLRSDSFAQGLVQDASRYGLSSAQMFWLHKKALEASGQAPTPTPAPLQIAQDMAPIQSLFRTAQQHLQHPKIKLAAGDQPVGLQVAGPRSKYAGEIMVTDAGKFGQGTYFGRIDARGQFHGARSVPDEVTVLLMAFAEDPAGIAAEYGRTSGNCCFCQRDLTDARSPAVGYGPKCAQHYDLPWGN